MPLRFLTLIIKKGILTHKDYGAYTCVAKGDNTVARDTVEVKKAGAYKQFLVSEK